MKNIIVGGIKCEKATISARDASGIIREVGITVVDVFDKNPSRRGWLFDELKNRLIEKYGKPKTEDRLEERDNIISNVFWTTGFTVVTLYRSEGHDDSGYLLLIYRPIDKKALDTL